MARAGGVALALSLAFSGCALLVGLDADYTAPPQAAEASTDTVIVEGGADARGRVDGNAGAPWCVTSPGVLACADLASPWPYGACSADTGNSVSFGSGAMVARVSSAKGAYCERAITATTRAIRYAIDVRVDTSSGSQAAYADVASLTFDTGYFVALSIYAGQWELDWGTLANLSTASLTGRVTTWQWTHVEMTIDAAHTVTVTFDGVVGGAVPLSSPPAQLQVIDVGPTDAMEGPFVLELRNVLVTAQ